MATLDWSQCPVVESVPGKVSGAWVFKDIRMPVANVFLKLEAGLGVEEKRVPDTLLLLTPFSLTLLSDTLL
jgi:hypothetical protein